ncbi:MAG: PAS domain S-box protein [Geobacter sp.]|nr:PAS domain S-box protein [Geobacter sp.]
MSKMSREAGIGRQLSRRLLPLAVSIGLLLSLVPPLIFWTMVRESHGYQAQFLFLILPPLVGCGLAVLVYKFTLRVVAGLEGEMDASRQAGESATELSRAVLDSINDPLYIIDVEDYRVLGCNAAFIKKHGVSEADVLGKRCYELTHKLDEPCHDEFDICPLKETLKTGKYSMAEHVHFQANGERAYEEISTSPVFDENCAIVKVVSVARDVTERRRAEEALRRAMEFSRTVMESVSDAVSIVDVNDYRLLGANTAFLEKVGMSEQEALGKFCYKLTHHYDEPCHEPYDICPLKETVATGKFSKADHTHFTATNEKYFTEVSTSPIFDESGRVAKVVHVARDITARKEMEEALRESEDKFRNLAEKALVGVYIIQDSVFRYVNPKICEIFGYGVDELTGRMGPRELTIQEDWPQVEEKLQERLSGEKETIHYEFRGMTKEKELVHLEVYGTRTEFQGKPAVIGTLLDVSDRKRAELALVEQGRQLKRLALVDELTGFYNRRGFLVIAGHQLKMAERLKMGALLVFAGVDGLKETGEQFGRGDVDRALQDTAIQLREIFRESDIIARLGDNEFVVLAVSSGHEGEDAIVSGFEEGIARFNAGENRKHRLSINFGVARFDPLSPCAIEDLIEGADAMMYLRKGGKKGDGSR